MTATRLIEPRYVDPRLERMRHDDFRSLQFSMLKDLIDQVWATNPFYQARWKAAGAQPDRIRSFEDFTTAIPATDKAAFLADQETAPPFGTRYDPTQGPLGQIHT